MGEAASCKIVSHGKASSAATAPSGRSLAATPDFGRFADIAAHDLNAPLRQITQVIGVFRMEAASRLSAAELRYLEQIEERALRSRILTKRLFDYMRAANAQINLESIDLSELVSSICVDLHEKMDGDGAKIRQDSLPTINGDRDLTEQLFRELISNAMEYHREGAQQDIRIASTHDGRAVTITDKGAGVDPANAARIFDPFTRSTAKPDVARAGMGLTIARMIAARQGWSIAMRSTPGAGTTVNVTLTG